MHLVHGFACTKFTRYGYAVLGLARITSGQATALKPTPEAGRRGGGSIARWGEYYYLFSAPERAPVALFGFLVCVAVVRCDGVLWCC